MVSYSVKPRRTRKEELQEAARQKAAAAMAKSKLKTRRRSALNAEGHKPVGTRTSKGTVTQKSTPVHGSQVLRETDNSKIDAKAINTTIINSQDGE